MIGLLPLLALPLLWSEERGAAGPTRTETGEEIQPGAVAKPGVASGSQS
jgi:hypothetical protein